MKRFLLLIIFFVYNLTVAQNINDYKYVIVPAKFDAFKEPNKYNLNVNTKLLLQKYGWPIIFIQRYMYGMRTVIPISIGLTRYDAKMFAFINLISAWCWAALTIVPVWYFGDEILKVLEWAKDHWYLAVLFIVVLVINHSNTPTFLLFLNLIVDRYPKK